MIDRITPLEREQWNGNVLLFHYISYNYYDVQITRAPQENMLLTLKQL
ncbi:MAG: hypothetical protein FWH33_04115 [Oscillospiraceae bacterium]|nr:hypothetical protein [Oscillospiraceae bacterium]